MGLIQQKVHKTLLLLIVGLYSTLDASQVAARMVILELADAQEYPVAETDLKKLAKLSKKHQIPYPSADKVSLQDLTKAGIEALITNLVTIKKGGRDLEALIRTLFLEKKASEILDCRKRLEGGDHLGIDMLKSADYLGIESVQTAVKEYLKLIVALKNHRSHKKDLRALYSDRNTPTPEPEEECSPDCAICLENHDERHEEEEALMCNHVFGRECIRSWETKSQYKDCPLCKAAISYKASGICALCNDPIDMREPSCTYDCNYRGCSAMFLSQWETERHMFHERCIAPYAHRAAFRSDEDFLKIKRGDVIFHCPVRHKKGTPNTKTDLKVPLSKVIPEIRFKHESFPSKVQEKTHCEICNTKIEWFQKKSSYKCHWLASEMHWGHSEKEHVFHENCLRPFAERTAYKHEDGKIYFFCPVDHDGAVRPQELVIPLLPGFTPDHVENKCGVCKQRVDENDSDVQLIEFNGYSRALSVDFIRERTWYHNKCFGRFIANSAVRKVAWGGEVKYMYPCPYHKDTPQAHEFVLSHHVVSDSPRGK